MTGANILGGVAIGWLLYNIFFGAKPLKIINIVEQLPKHPTLSYDVRSLDQILRHVVHHSAHPTWKVEDVANFHVQSNGWPGIGYHFFIDKFGRVYQTNNLETISYHVKDENTGSIGYCLQGNLEETAPTNAQLDALVKTIQYVNVLLGKTLPIDGHRDHRPTACPGQYVDVDKIENRVYQNQA